MMLIRIIIMLLIALFVESRQEAFGQTTDTLSLSDKVIRTASFATGFRGEIWQNPALYYYYTPYIWTRLDVNGAYHDKGSHPPLVHTSIQFLTFCTSPARSVSSHT